MNIKEALQVLGLQEGARPADVKAAYHGLAKKHHPDANPGVIDAEETFKRLNEANDVLTKNGTDPAADVDQSSFHTFTGFSDIMDIMDQMRFAHAMGINSNSTIQTQIGVPVSAFFTGTSFEYRYNRFINHNGSGRQILETIKIDVDPSTPVGSVKTFSQKGHHLDPNKPVGDLKLILIPVSDETYQVNGLNLTRNLDLDVLDAMLGISLEIDCPDGSKVRLKIKPGTQHEAIYRMNGKGLYDGRRRGTLDVMVHLRVPQLTPKELASLKTVVDEFRSPTDPA